jgi:hypothetical protein
MLVALPQLHDALDYLMLERGESMVTAEREIIDAATLSQEQRDALWLYAWALRSRAARRPRRALT